MPTTQRVRVLIIGAGPAGYTAAIYAARAGLEPLVVQGMQPGGQLTTTHEIENYPGTGGPVDGTQLMDRMREQAESVGARTVWDVVTAVDFSQRPYVCTGGEATYIADAVIICTGAQAKWLGNEPENKFMGSISACAVCDGHLSRNKPVAVIGGGSSALTEALYLANLASKVTIVHRRDAFRGEQVLQDRVLNHPKIDVVWNAAVEEWLGSDAEGLRALRLRRTDGTALELPMHAAFVAIGHQPATAMFRGQVEMDAEGYIVTPPWSTKCTLLSGAPADFIAAAGDCVDRNYRQAVTAAGMGCMAALEIERAFALHGH